MSHADLRELKPDTLPSQEWVFWSHGLLMGPIQHPGSPIREFEHRMRDLVAPALAHAMKILAEQWQAMSEVLDGFTDPFEQSRKPPRHGPPGRRPTPWVIHPTGHCRQHARQHRRRGRRPREHQFRRTNTRAPPTHQPQETDMIASTTVQHPFRGDR